MTLQEKIDGIISRLNAVGTAYNSYELYKFGQAVANELNKEYGCTDYNNRFGYRDDAKTGTSEVYFHYHGHTRTIAAIKVSKAKAGRHYHYGSSYMDWTIKSVTSFAYTEDIPAVMAECINGYHEAEASKQRKLDRAVGAFRLLMDTYGMSKYEVDSLVDFMKSNSWTIHELVDKKAE